MIKKIFSAAFLITFFPFILNAQITTGTGFFINLDGLILTNQHVANSSCQSIVIINESGDRYPAQLISESDKYDLSIIQTSYKSRYMSFIRMTENYQRPDIPKLDESVHTTGYLNGELESRGGFVKELSDPKHNNFGFTVGLGTEQGASGSPVYDDNALVVGILWGKRIDDENILSMYALDARAIFEFVQQTGINKNVQIQIGTSNINDNPYGESSNDYFYNAERAHIIGKYSTVNIYCRK